jgi:hypothetical protein
MSVIASGPFAIEMEISDGAAKVTSIPSVPSLLSYKHIITVVNMSKHPQHSRAKAALPRQRSLLQFVGSSLGLTEWQDETKYSIGPAATHKFNCGIEGARCGTGVDEPIDCVELFSKRGSRPWNSLTHNIPYRTQVDVV